jgi:hypothetical protein
MYSSYVTFGSDTINQNPNIGYEIFHKHGGEKEKGEKSKWDDSE